MGLNTTGAFQPGDEELEVQIVYQVHWLTHNKPDSYYYSQVKTDILVFKKDIALIFFFSFLKSNHVFDPFD